MARRPILYLLSGLPCSGKTTYALSLEAAGVVRILVDEMLIESVGRLGVDYDQSEHTRLLEPIVVAARSQVGENLSEGHDVVLDHGLGRRDERDDLKQLAEAAGASWTLLCFDADYATLRDRCRQRSELPGAIPISEETLAFLARSWERPLGEGEPVITTTGR